MKFININIESNIAILTINRPKFLNALNQKLIEELSNKLDQIRPNEKIRVVIIRGEGNKSFVAGADIKEFASFDVVSGSELLQAIVRNNKYEFINSDLVKIEYKI